MSEVFEGEGSSGPPYYATVAELREKLGMDEEMLPEAEALALLSDAEDLIDERLLNRPADPDTGRKVVPANEEGWRVAKLAKGTLEIAKALFEDPGVASRRRASSESGDVSASGFYGPAFGELAEAAINASGLRVNRARMAGNRQRCRR